eukprot:scaffold252233_cov46-Prasinocladus_malaysianus.AAC.1
MSKLRLKDRLQKLFAQQGGGSEANSPKGSSHSTNGSRNHSQAPAGGAAVDQAEHDEHNHGKGIVRAP